MNITKDELKKTLKESVVAVTFLKKDNTQRKMICTLNEDHLPKVEKTEAAEKTKADNPNNIAVWDIEKQAWRSFRIDSIINFEINQ